MHEKLKEEFHGIRKLLFPIVLTLFCSADNLDLLRTMAEKYIIMLQVPPKVDDLEVATKVSVQLRLTDPDLKSRDRVVKKSEKDNLYAAMDVAAVWLAWR